MAKTQEVERDINSELSELMSEVNNQYGDALMLLDGASGRWPDDRVIRTGSLEMDLASGIGGWPRGRINCIYGEESSGKSTAALLAIAEVQRRGGIVAYIDAENTLDPGYMKKLGIDPAKVLVNQTSILETAIDIMVTLLGTGKVDLLVVDSIPALKARHVMENDAETETRALEARRWSAQMPRVVQAASGSNTCVLFINQTRDSMSMYTAESLPGGRTLKFAFSTMVRLRKRLEGKGNDDGIDYHEANFDFTKNKVGSPFKKGSFILHPGRGVDRAQDLFYAAISKDVILKDVKIDDDGDEINKKGWVSIRLQDGDAAAILEENPDAPLESDEDEWLNIYRDKPFQEFLESVPNFCAVLEERVLDTLNDGATVITSDTESGELAEFLEANENDEEGDE